MNDFSLLIIKPEILSRENEVIISLKKRGYEVLSKKHYKGWKEISKQIYTELSSEQINAYIEGYNKYGWGDEYVLLVIKHKDGETLQRLNKEKGNFIAYQTKKGDTLRREFGWSSEKNLYANGMTLTYPGVHCPADNKELNRDLKIFKVNI